MIRELIASISCCIIVSLTSTQAEATAVPFDTLVDRTLGTTGRPVVFDWRRRSNMISFRSSELLERNVFESYRFGAEAFIPSDGMMMSLGIAKVITTETDGSLKVGKTPYRQLGRPSRWELDFGLRFPLAEGIVTMRPSFLNTAEMVFHATARARYLVYPSAFGKLKGLSMVKAMFSTRLTETEIHELGKIKPSGMNVDSARLNFLVGAATDVYTKDGFFVTPEAQVALPALGTELGPWWELTLGFGYALP
jgi:hypothetical protein